MGEEEAEVEVAAPMVSFEVTVSEGKNLKALVRCWNER
jgi:hypothetical protein